MRRWSPLIVSCIVCACANSPVRIESRVLGDQAAHSPEHYIIAAVDSEPVAFLARAGSTPRSYDAIAPYGPTSAAVRVLRSLENDYGLREVNAWPIAPLHMHCAVLEIPEGADRTALLAVLSRDQRIKLAQPLQTFATRTQHYNDPYVGLQRGFAQMNVAGAHPWSRGEGVKIAIIDTGADTLHADLRGRIAAAENFVDSDERRFRRDRHGTEMAGVIAAVANNHEGIVGIAPAARLLVYKACWQAADDADEAHCNSFTLARALVAAFDARAQVINMSLAGPEDQLLGDLIREGVHRGVLFVGAAAAVSGDGRGGLLHLPGVIEVASAENHAAAGPVIYAPGREILTLLPGGHYDFATGDSIATAQVTGVVALLLAKNAALSSARAYQILRDSSASNASGTSGAAGAGAAHIDACAAVVSLLGQGSCSRSADADQRLAEQREGDRGAAH